MPVCERDGRFQARIFPTRRGEVSVTFVTKAEATAAEEAGKAELASMRGGGVIELSSEVRFTPPAQFECRI